MDDDNNKKKRSGNGFHHHHHHHPQQVIRVWFVRLCTSILVWTGIIQLTTVIQPHLLHAWPTSTSTSSCLDRPRLDLLINNNYSNTLPPSRIYKSNGYLKVSCNGGLNQMRAAICDMVTVARYLNLTLVIPELDKTSFWADPREETFHHLPDHKAVPRQCKYNIICIFICSDFKDIFNVKYFISSLRDEVRIVKSLPKKLSRKSHTALFSMPPVSWSNDKYYLKQILPLFRKHKLIHFNKTDARLANNGIPDELQRLRCRVNYKALRFTPQIEALGSKLISILQKNGFFVVIHLRYEMDMLAFSGCTHGCSADETNELTRMRYAYPWWKEKEIVSEKKRLDGLCPLTPEETALVLEALGIARDTRIYIASGEIYGGERRLSALRAAYPKIVRKEMLLDQDDLRPFQNHSTQMAALDYMVSIASDVFIPTYDGNMAKVVEGHRRYLGFRKTISLDRRELVELLDLYQNNTLSWAEFTDGVRHVHEIRMGQPNRRKVIPEHPKEEDYFYANPQECLTPLVPESEHTFL
ncbi:hypothetical protein GIB67_006722 [Kingdonia uniflora]|uniref:O-fucosyltransferase family protein n=1 Tax=Kingdonia uniflora TaxID=39325 RepID=A0A7J7LYR4_9MAGN|nr:hypothetical protein GIB67_006722 [Kingdonia uniflora]